MKHATAVAVVVTVAATPAMHTTVIAVLAVIAVRTGEAAARC